MSSGTTKYSTPSFDIIQQLQNELKALRRRVNQLENSQVTTVPILGKASLANRDVNPGQLIIGFDNTLNYCVGTVDQVSVYEIQGTLFTTQ